MIRSEEVICFESELPGCYDSCCSGEEERPFIPAFFGQEDRNEPGLDRRAEAVAGPRPRLRPGHDQTLRRTARSRAEVPLRHNRRDGPPWADGPTAAERVWAVGGGLRCLQTGAGGDSPPRPPRWHNDGGGRS